MMCLPCLLCLLYLLYLPCLLSPLRRCGVCAPQIMEDVMSSVVMPASVVGDMPTGGNKSPHAPPTKFVLFDFTSVNGLDATAARSCFLNLCRTLTPPRHQAGLWRHQARGSHREASYRPRDTAGGDRAECPRLRDHRRGARVLRGRAAAGVDRLARFIKMAGLFPLPLPLRLKLVFLAAARRLGAWPGFDRCSLTPRGGLMERHARRSPSLLCRAQAAR